MKAVRPESSPSFSKTEPVRAVNTLELTAGSYLRLKAESERISIQMETLRKVLEPELAKRPEGKLFVDGFDRYLHLIDRETRTFDLAGAEKRKNLAKLIAPYIETTRKLDLESALKHVDNEMLKPFIDAKPSTMLKTPKRKEGDE